MNQIVVASPRQCTPQLDGSRFPAVARWVLRLLERFEHGTLDLTLPDGQRARFGRGAPRADLVLRNWNVFGAALRSGDIGFAESYLDGDWTTSDLTQLLVVFLRNRAAAEQVIYGSLAGGLVHRLRHFLRRNSRAQARKNIHAHYDLGNDFYALWLDPTFTYSSGLFAELGDVHAPADEPTLQAAQRAKYARALAELRLRPGATLLEIGCGWGGFAEQAAAAGHVVHGLTLSAAQLEHARARLARTRPAPALRLQDYRDEHGLYDGIVSIEMFEAVGEAYWPAYFATLARCLKPGARACVQTITIDAALFERYRHSTDFIQQYIFPGGMLPAAGVFESHARAAGLRVVGRFAFGRHYARTLASWRARFESRLAAVRAQGFDDRFIAIWRFYLSYCEAAFAEGNTDVVQFTLERS